MPLQLEEISRGWRDITRCCTPCCAAQFSRVTNQLQINYKPKADSNTKRQNTDCYLLLNQAQANMQPLLLLSGLGTSCVLATQAELHALNNTQMLRLKNKKKKKRKKTDMLDVQ